MKVSTRLSALVMAALVVSPVLVTTARAAAAPVTGLVIGEVERLSVDNPADVWSGGLMVVGHQNVIIPRNLLFDLPANRLSLQQIFVQASPACQANGESGLAKADRCNLSGAGANATVSANKTAGGNVIAGDVFVQKGLETVTGTVTFINHDQGYFRLNGITGNDTTGVMVRINDPVGRHTVQLGLGCDGGPNCSADPRFTADTDNYTVAFATGYPLCIPSTVKRTFADVLDFDNNPATRTLDAQAHPNGTGDVLCPVDVNRASTVAGDSRRLAPIVTGDHLLATGNFETIKGVRFLSAWQMTVSTALRTRPDPGQPDYVAMLKSFIDAPAFQLRRVRTEFKGLATLNTDVMFWSVHRDPVHDAPHEFPLATVVGCEAAAGLGVCSAIGVNPGNTLFVIKHDVDFILGARPKLSPCAHLRADPRFSVANPCPTGGSTAENFGVLSPIPREIQARTGRKFADLNGGGNVLQTLDIKGAQATNGQFVFPFGIGLGGINVPAPIEFDPGALTLPYSFSGLPWAMDRRLSPGGCMQDPCDATPQPLDPFPFEGFDPRTQGFVPSFGYTDPVFTKSPLTNESNRILSFVDAASNKFNGNASVLAWPPADPAARPIVPTPALAISRDLVTGVTPDRGPAGSTVVIDGTNIGGAVGVTFGGAPADATKLKTIDGSHVSAVVPVGAATGPVGVTTPAGQVPTSARFSVVPVPTIAGFVPAAVAPGSSITVTGTGLTTALDVSVGGISTTFSVLSDANLRAVVPATAKSGLITVTTVGGSATTSATLTVVDPTTTTTAAPTTTSTTTAPTTTLAPSTPVAPTTVTPTTVAPTTATAAAPPPAPKPAITGFSPASGAAGAAVVITGSGFTGATALAFNTTPATFTVVSDTSITTKVPPGATTGPLQVTTPGGVALSAASFSLIP